VCWHFKVFVVVSKSKEYDTNKTEEHVGAGHQTDIRELSRRHLGSTRNLEASGEHLGDICGHLWTFGPRGDLGGKMCPNHRVFVRQKLRDRFACMEAQRT
jgi:hypothetical protein